MAIAFGALADCALPLGAAHGAAAPPAASAPFTGFFFDTIRFGRDVLTTGQLRREGKCVAHAPFQKILKDSRCVVCRCSKEKRTVVREGDSKKLFP